MEFNTKEYRIMKIKKKFKNLNFFFIFLGNSGERFLIDRQALKELSIKSYQMGIIPAKKVFNESIFINFIEIITIYPNIVELRTKNDESLQNVLDYTFLSLKLNNKLYLKSQITILKSFVYKSKGLFIANPLKKRNRILKFLV